MLLAGVAGNPAALVVRPGPHGPDGVRALCEARLGGPADPAFAAACADATGGNPLVLQQLLSALDADGVRPTADGAAAVRETGPRAVSRTVLLRLARLPAAAAAVARAVAVLGEQATLPAVAPFGALDDAEVAAGAGALARADVLEGARSQGGTMGAPLAFVHPLVRGAVYDD